MGPRPPQLFESDIHRPRWQRALIWICESDAGRSTAAVALCLFIGVPLFLIGWWWGAIVVAALAGFVAGYWCARAFWRAGQDVPPL